MVTTLNTMFRSHRAIAQALHMKHTPPNDQFREYLEVRAKCRVCHHYAIVGFLSQRTGPSAHRTSRGIVAHAFLVVHAPCSFPITYHTPTTWRVKDDGRAQAWLRKNAPNSLPDLPFFQSFVQEFSLKMPTKRNEVTVSAS